MNRRLFLAGAGASTATIASLGLANKRLYAQSASPDSNLINAAIANSSTTTANIYGGGALTWSDWHNHMSVQGAMRNDILSKGLDSSFIQSAYGVTNLDPASINMAQITSNIQIYQPAFQLSDLQAYFASFPQDQASLGAALSNLKQVGLSGHLLNVINQAYLMSKYATQVTQYDDSPPDQRVLQRPAYNCAADGAAILAFGTAFIVIGIMAGPAGVLAYAFWEGLSFWGGVGAGVWGAGHSVACGF